MLMETMLTHFPPGPIVGIELILLQLMGISKMVDRHVVGISILQLLGIWFWMVRSVLLFIYIALIIIGIIHTIAIHIITEAGITVGTIRKHPTGLTIQE
jgi:hypothetical protein